MSRLYFLKVFIFPFILVSFLGCNSKNSESSNSSTTETSINQKPDTPKVTEKDISTIKESLNKDSNYILLKEDQSFLASEGITESEDQLNTWVQ